MVDCYLELCDCRYEEGKHIINFSSICSAPNDYKVSEVVSRLKKFEKTLLQLSNERFTTSLENENWNILNGYFEYSKNLYVMNHYSEKNCEELFKVDLISEDGFMSMGTAFKQKMTPDNNISDFFSMVECLHTYCVGVDLEEDESYDLQKEGAVNSYMRDVLKLERRSRVFIDYLLKADKFFL